MVLGLHFLRMPITVRSTPTLHEGALVEQLIALVAVPGRVR